ncbi:MAG: twin-arginine translocation signal domain-containing protein [Phycisphaerae bacterium]|jgi:hypothetical protein|nr:twin-arginine translocation signal domain-containing protein [Phycisphaerae bacterium]
MNRRDFLRGVFGSAVTAVAGPLLPAATRTPWPGPVTPAWSRTMVAVDLAAPGSDYIAWYYLQMNNVPMIVYSKPQRSFVIHG